MELIIYISFFIISSNLNVHCVKFKEVNEQKVVDY